MSTAASSYRGIKPSVLFLVTGALSFALPFLVSLGNLDLIELPIQLGLALLVLGLAMLPNDLATARVGRRMERGEDVLTTWLLSPDQWKDTADREAKKVRMRNAWLIGYTAFFAIGGSLFLIANGSAGISLLLVSIVILAVIAFLLQREPKALLTLSEEGVRVHFGPTAVCAQGLLYRWGGWTDRFEEGRMEEGDLILRYSRYHRRRRIMFEFRVRIPGDRRVDAEHLLGFYRGDPEAAHPYKDALQRIQEHRSHRGRRRVRVFVGIVVAMLLLVAGAVLWVVFDRQSDLSGTHARIDAQGTRLLVLRAAPAGTACALVFGDVGLSSEKVLVLADAATGGSRILMRESDGDFGDVTFSIDGTLLGAVFAGERREVLRIWSVKDGQVLREIDVTNDDFDVEDQIRFSPDGLRIASRGDDIRCWTLNDGRPVPLVACPDSMARVLDVGWAEDGTVVGLMDGEAGAFLWNHMDGRPLPAPSLRGLISDHAFSASGGRLVIQDDAGYLCLDAATGKTLSRTDCPASAATRFSLDARGRILLGAATRDAVLTRISSREPTPTQPYLFPVVDLDQGVVLAFLGSPRDGRAVLSPDGTLALLQDEEGRTVTWMTVPAGTLVSTMRHRDGLLSLDDLFGEVFATAIVGDGTYALTGNVQVCVWKRDRR